MLVKTNKLLGTLVSAEPAGNEAVHIAFNALSGSGRFHTGPRILLAQMDACLDLPYEDFLKVLNWTAAEGKAYLDVSDAGVADIKKTLANPLLHP